MSTIEELAARVVETAIARYKTKDAGGYFDPVTCERHEEACSEYIAATQPTHVIVAAYSLEDIPIGVQKTADAVIVNDRGLWCKIDGPYQYPYRSFHEAVSRHTRQGVRQETRFYNNEKYQEIPFNDGLFWIP